MAHLLVFLCSPPSPPHTCTFVSPSAAAVTAHLLLSHTGISLFRRRYGAAALAQLPLPATLLSAEPPAEPPAFDLAGLPVFICTDCENYFVRRRAFLEHMTHDAAHAATSAASIEDLGEYPFEDATAQSHARILVLGVPAATAPPVVLHRRLMINYTTPHVASHCTVSVPAGTHTIAALESLLQAPYEHRRIGWDAIWAAGLVVRYTTGGAAHRVLVKVDEDVRFLAGVLDYGECWVGDERS